MNVNRTLAAFLLITAAISTQAEDRYSEEHRYAKNHQYSEKDIRGTWTYSGWVEATLLIPFAAEITHSTPPSALVGAGEKVALKGTLVGLFTFDGKGKIAEFQDLFKAGGAEPTSPPFPLPYVPPFLEQGDGKYSVEPNGIVQLETLIINPADGSVAGEADYACVLNRKPKRLDCMFARFKTFVVDPGGFNAPIVGRVTLRPQR